MDPSMILYTEDSPHFHSAEDAVNAHSASLWRSASPRRPERRRRWSSTIAKLHPKWLQVVSMCSLSITEVYLT